MAWLQTGWNCVGLKTVLHELIHAVCTVTPLYRHFSQVLLGAALVVGGAVLAAGWWWNRRKRLLKGKM